MSKSLGGRGSELIREADRVWYVNAHTELYRDGEPSFASGTPVSRIASVLQLSHYVPPPEPYVPSAECKESNPDECIALYMYNSSNHSLVLIDCSKTVSTGIICKRPYEERTTRTTKSPVQTTANEAPILVPRWPNSGLYVHTLTSNATIEYRAILVTGCPRDNSSWYCARHRCAASGGHLAALEKAHELQEVFERLKDVLKKFANRPTQTDPIILYLDVHRHLYSPNNEEQVPAEGEINYDEQTGMTEKYFWSTGSVFAEQSLSSCDH